MSLSDTLSNTSNTKTEFGEPVTFGPTDELTATLIGDFAYFQDSMSKKQESEAQRRQK